jgi:hypothetical protein
MHYQYLSVVQSGQQVFGAAVQPLNDAPRQAFSELPRERKPQIRPTLLYPRKGVAHENGLQSAANGLDFRQFRHGPRRNGVRNSAQRGYPGSLQCKITIVALQQ